jgi:subtilisin family serine protease
MKFFLLLSFAFVLSAAIVQGEAPAGSADARADLLEQIANGYIVKLRSGFEANEFIAERSSLMADDNEIEHTYDAGNIAAAIQHVTRVARRGKTVINMSLSGDTSRVIDDAVNAAAGGGVAVIIAFGNDHADACRESPARATFAFAVGSSDKNDHELDFNIGRCVQLYAPGTDVRSLTPSGGRVSMDGTSMTTPHVAGVAAIYMGARTYDNISDLYKALVNNATPDAISNASRGTPNRLIFHQL